MALVIFGQAVEAAEPVTGQARGTLVAAAAAVQVTIQVAAEQFLDVLTQQMAQLAHKHPEAMAHQAHLTPTLEKVVLVVQMAQVVLPGPTE